MLPYNSKRSKHIINTRRGWRFTKKIIVPLLAISRKVGYFVSLFSTSAVRELHTDWIKGHFQRHINLIVDDSLQQKTHQVGFFMRDVVKLKCHPHDTWKWWRGNNFCDLIVGYLAKLAQNWHGVTNTSWQKHPTVFIAWAISLKWLVCHFCCRYYRNESAAFDEEDGYSYTLSFNINFPHDDDTVYLAHCYPYTYR